MVRFHGRDARHTRGKTKPPGKFNMPTGQRLVPSIAFMPANLLQLQLNAGNKAVVELIKSRYGPNQREIPPFSLLRAARRDGIEPIRDADAESVILSEGPLHADWNFHYMNGDVSSGPLYWITLEHYKNRQRHFLFTPEGIDPILLNSSELSEAEQTTLLDWASQFLEAQLDGLIPAEPVHAPASANSSEELEELPLGDLLSGDDDDEEDQSG